MKGKIALIAIAVVALIVAFVGYFLTSEEREVEYKTYINENYSFKFDYPVEWIFEGWSLSRMDSDISNFLVTENVSDKIGGAISLEVMETDVFLENFLENFILWSGEFTLTTGPTEIVIDGVHAVKYLLKSTSRIQLEFISAKKDGYLYIFQFLAHEEKYDDYEPIFEHVIDSFSFLEN